MGQANTLRFLDLVRRELGALDARAELGGKDPDDPRLLFTRLPDGFRLVVVFERCPRDRAGCQARLERLAETFSHTLAVDGPAGGDVKPGPGPAAHRLDAALEALRSRADCAQVIVTDAKSPVLGGSSAVFRRDDDVDLLAATGQALEAAAGAGMQLAELIQLEPGGVVESLERLGVEAQAAALLARAARGDEQVAVRHMLLTARAVFRLRGRLADGSNTRWVTHEPEFGYLARVLGNIYQLIMVFDGAFSELHAESALVHAQPVIEQLLFALPPVDPPPHSARVIRLKR